MRAERRIVLDRLVLTNFKGVRQFEFRPDGRSASVLGRNASGKTTLADAYAWLLFEKDSQGRKEFDIKTLVNGRALSGVDHEVEGVFRVDGEELSLRRVFAEKWTKKRGAAVAELTGHTTEHFVDGVPVTKGEYTAKVSEIADEATWRLLSDPGAFQALHWQERRRVVLDVCGDVSDADVIAANGELADLPNVLGRRSLDEHRKVVASRKQQLNRELLELPARIDEVTRALPERPELSAKQVEAGLSAARERHQAVVGELAAVRAGGGDAASERRRLREVEDALTDLDRQARRKADEAVDAASVKVAAARRALAEAEERLARWAGEATDLEGEVEALDRRLEELRAQWRVVNDRVIDPHVEGVCPACKQALPPEQVREAHAAAVADLNGRKARELAQINEDGRALAARRERVAAELALVHDRSRNQSEGLSALKGDVMAAEAALAKAQAAPASDVIGTPAYAKLAGERDDLIRRIKELTSGDQGAAASLEEREREAREAVRVLEGDAAAWQAIARGEERTAELRGQERRLTREHEELERQLHLCDLFVRTKVELLEGKVAGKFKRVRFKLFEQQVNGGVAEVCTATVDGVPFESVNHAGQIAAGLDIIRTLQAHHGLSAPVWVDQAESISEVPVTGAQQITLVVNPSEKQLRVELQREEVAA